jgi:hypothetical protein
VHDHGSPPDRGYPSRGGYGGDLDPPAGMEAGGGGGERWPGRVWRWHTRLHTRRVPSRLIRFCHQAFALYLQQHITSSPRLTGDCLNKYSQIVGQDRCSHGRITGLKQDGGPCLLSHCHRSQCPAIVSYVFTYLLFISRMFLFCQHSSFLFLSCPVDRFICKSLYLTLDGYFFRWSFYHERAHTWC